MNDKLKKIEEELIPRVKESMVRSNTNQILAGVIESIELLVDVIKEENEAAKKPAAKKPAAKKPAAKK